MLPSSTTFTHAMLRALYAAGRRVLALAALSGILTTLGSPPAFAAPASLVLRDAVSRHPIAGARVTVRGVPQPALDTGNGTYALPDLPPGTYDVDVSDAGYRAATVRIGIPGTLSILLYASDAATALHTIAEVHSAASPSGANGTVLNTTIGSVDLSKTATFRLADALLNLPEISASAVTASATNMTASQSPTTTPLMGGPGSYVQMSIRGFGTIESPALIDGHPIGQGVDLGFDFQDAPTFGLGSVFVGYGSDAAALYGVGGAGVIDMRTLSPSAQPSYDVLQGIGSYGLRATALRSTGTTANGSVGWAFAYGVDGTGGPLNGTFYAPTASLDPSNPADVPSASYAFSDDTNRRNLLGKLSLRIGNGTTLVLKGFDATAWADGTGDNSDAIYKTAAVATAQGEQLLAAKQPGDPCPTGEFTVYSQLIDFTTGAPEPQSVPCQTPQQYGAFNAGFQGIGPHYVAERVSDYGATLSTTYETLAVNVDLFTNSYYWNYDRSDALPYSNPQYPFGAAILPYLGIDQLVVNTGGAITIDKLMGDHDPYVAVHVMSNSNLFTTGPIATAPVVGSSSAEFGDHWMLGNGRIDVDAGGAFSSNDATKDGSWFDPHVSISAALTARDRVRFSAGTSTISPAALWLDTPYTPTTLGDFQSAITCSAPNSVGNVPSNALLPERIGDQELTFSHDWGGGAFTALDLYDARLTNKIYAATVPVSLLPTDAIPDSELAPYRDALLAQCGSDATLAASGNFNIGSARANGADLVGRIPVPGARRLALDYSYSVESSVLESVDTPWFLPYNLSFIPGSQLPGVPLHKYSVDLDYTQPNGIDATLRRYWVSDNNPSNLPAYGFSDLAVGVPVAPALRVHVMVDNLFNENAETYAYAGLGVPTPLNAYATPADYARYSGYGATILAPLAPRNLLVTFDFAR